MSSSNEQKLNIKDERNYPETNSFNLNEIKFIKRTLENNTHEVLEDKRLKTITTWRKSKSKFYKVLIFNILTIGILHWISLHYPNLFIKLYCNPSSAKECDFFLVENIYGQYTLCIKNHKKPKNSNAFNINSDYTEENIISSTLINNNKSEYNISKNLTYSFKYKSMIYEYNLETNIIIPVYMDVSKMTNKNIINFFGEGLFSQNLVKKVEERFGKNEYYINPNLLHLYFKKVEAPTYIILLLIGLVEIILKDYISFIIKLFFIIIIILNEYIYSKLIAYNIYKDENTLDGEKKIKVKRKYLCKDKDNFYIEIENKDLLPGDIVYLKINDIVPCDCIIIEGKCLVNQSNSTGNLDILKKESLINNNEEFNYQSNKNNILLHGMKIIRTFSKLKEKYISVLCLNTGPNTFKANQYSNILYFSERKTVYKDVYNFFGSDRKAIVVGIIISFIISILLGIGYTFLLNMNIEPNILKSLAISCFLREFFKSFMSAYFFTHSIILMKGLHNLKRNNIICYDKCRLLFSYNINTIIFSATSVITESSFDINTYNTVYIGNQKSNKIIYKTFKDNQYKEMNIELFKYYKEYINKNQTLNNNSRNIRKAQIFRNNTLNDKSNNYTVLFLECLLSSNNLEKINNEIFGNILEIKMFDQMKWDIKSYDYSYIEEENNEIKDNDLSYFNAQSNKNKENNEYNNYYIDRKINDIFPKNYYKITESLRIERNKQKKLERLEKTQKLKKLISQNTDLKHSKKNILNENIKINESIKLNQIIEDILNSHINSYKIRIYKRFIKEGSLTSGAIVYNFITKELRFMIKGIPEDILDNCEKNSLPENFEKIISLIRMEGFKVIICATKLIDIEEYNDYNSVNYYMNNLIFCGFITLKNKLNNEIKNSINELKQLGCKLIISSGNNIYNCLSCGFNSDILENNKNIFNINKDDNDKILINKILNIKNINIKEKEKEKENENEKITSDSFDLYSKRSKRTLSRQKSDNSDYSYNNNQRQISKKTIRKTDILKSQIIEENEKRFYQTPKSFNKKENENIKTPNIELSSIRKRSKNQIYKKIPSLNLSNDSENKKLNQSNEMESNKLYTKKLSSELKNPKSKSSQKIKITKRRRTNFEIFLEKHFFYPNIFKDYKELNNNCIYCLSGQAFNYLYNNKNRKEYKYLLQQIQKYCKIFYDMSSVNKSTLVEFLQQFENNCICYIGKSESDSDAIITSNIGINLEQPKNMNTILCHFYTNKSDILCIKDIILEGRAIHENILILKLVSIFCTFIINSYILCCFICHINAIIGQLNILELCLILFSIIAFTEKSNNKIEINHFINNSKCFYIIEFIGLFFLKLVIIYLFCSNHNNGPNDDFQENAKIFCTFYFILCMELLFTTGFIFNFDSFYRENIYENKMLIFFIIIFIFYILLLLTLNSSNYHYDLFNIHHFEFLNQLIDSYSDRNKILAFNIFVIDIGSTFIYSRIIYYIFNRISKK